MTAVRTDEETRVVWINRPASIHIRRITHCPTCNQRRRFAGFDQLWYGPTWTCLACGDSWHDGQRVERPFKRGWREEARARAAKYWATGVRNLSPAHRDWLEEQLAPYRVRPVEDVELPAEEVSG